jgi:hypothetical protein
MLATEAPTTVGPARRPMRAAGDLTTRLAGLGALAFVGVVILQNLIRGSSSPANGASSDEVLRYYADHRSTVFVLVATFLVAGAALVTFLGGAMRRLTASDRPGWACTGFVGAVGILVLFCVLVAAEQALSVVAHGDAPDPGAVSALWALHNSVFTLLLAAIGVALLGLSRAGVAAGITPPVFTRLAPLGSALLVLGCVAGPAIAAGEAMPVFGISVLGFLVWLAFLVTTGLRLVRAEAVTA